MIIGLTGYAQSGKDTLAGMLIGLHKYDNRAFADPIRKLLYETNPLVKDGYRVKTVVDAYGWDKAKVEFPELRGLLQTLGVGARTVFNDQFWVAQGLAGLSAGDKIVITDVRFPNEGEYYNKIKINPSKISNPRIFTDEVFFNIDGITVATRKEDWEKIEQWEKIGKEN